MSLELVIAANVRGRSLEYIHIGRFFGGLTSRGSGVYRGVRCAYLFLRYGVASGSLFLSDISGSQKTDGSYLGWYRWVSE